MSTLYACTVCGKPTRSRRCPSHTTDRQLGVAYRQRRERILTRDGWLCRDPDHPPDRTRYLTEVPHLSVSAHVAHRIPLDDGGLDTDTNLYASCGYCNIRRRTRPLDAPITL